jgi:two-component system NtrC family response regulator
VGGTETFDVDIRIVAATNKNLQEAVSHGEFREDLFYRLNVVSIFLPPLRERREDIPLLAAHFLDKYTKENQVEIAGFTGAAMDYLTAYEWPGNVRQLENVVERCTVLARSDTIDADDLPPEIKDEEAQFKSAVDLLPSELNLAETMDKIEGALVKRALARADFVQVKAAEMLGLSKSNLQYKLKKYDLMGKAK